jgi:hypothetical protein
MKTTTKNLLFGTAAILGLALAPLATAADEVATKTGEVVDLACYLDHGASGEAHSACAQKCISSGLPVGLKTADGTYLLVGAHKPMNKEIEALAAQTITVKGKVVEKDGIKMIENAEVVTK